MIINYPVLTIGVPSDTVICAGERIKIPYTNSNSDCPVGFQLSDANGNNFTTIQPSTYIPPNVYELPIPENLSQGDNYRIRIVNYAKYTYPAPSDSVLGQFTLSIKARPKITLTNNNLSGVFINETPISLNFSLSGAPPFSFYFNQKRYSSNTNSAAIDYIIKKSEFLEYGNVSDASGCYEHKFSSIFVQAEAFPKITTLPAETPVGFVSAYKYRNYCRGQQMRVNYKILGNLPVNTPLKVQIKKTNTSVWLDIPSSIGFEEQQLIVTIPTDATQGYYETRIIPTNSAIFVLQGTETIPNFVIASNVFTVIEPIKAQIMASPDSIYIRSKEKVSLRLKIEGGMASYISDYYSSPTYLFSIKNSQNNKIFSTNSNYNGVAPSEFLYVIDTLTRSTTFEIASVQSPIECPSTIIKGKLKVLVEKATNNIKISQDGQYDWYYNNCCICGGSQLTIPIWKSGVYNADNKFKIFLSNYSTPNSFFEVPAIDNGNNTFTITIPTSDKNVSYYVRAESTSPKVVGATNSNTLNVTKQIPQMKLTGEYFVTAGSLVEIQAQIGTIDVSQNVIITDGTNDYTFYVNQSYTANNQIFKIRIPTNTPTSDLNFRIKPFSNTCGAVITDAGITVHVAAPLMVISQPSNLCFSGTMSPSFTFISNIAFGSGNKFKARVANRNNPDSYYEYDAFLQDGIITFSYSNITFGSNSNLQIISSDPYTISNVFQYYELSKPSVSIGTPYSSVEKGSLVSLTYTFTGSPPFTMKVMEGENFATYQSTATSLIRSFTAESSTAFRAIEVSDANCLTKYAQYNNYSNIPYLYINVVEKNALIEITNLNKLDFCRNEMITVDFLEKDANNSYVLQLSEFDKNEFIDLESSKQNAQIVAFLPNSLAIGTKYKVRIKAINNNSVLYSLNYHATIIIHDSPTATISGGGNLLNNTQQNAPLNFKLQGGGSWQVNYSDGANNYQFNTSDSLYSVKVKPSESTNYFITSITNSCGNGTPSGNAFVNVLDINTKHIVGLDGICFGQNLIVPFIPKGNFEPNNQFKIQLYRNDPFATNVTTNYYTLDAVLDGNALFATIPTNLPFSANGNTPYNIRVISTNPTVLGTYATNLTNSQADQLFVWGYEPIISLTGNSSISQGESLDLNVNVEGNSNFWYVRIDDGQHNYFYYPQNFPYKITVNPTQTTTFTINQFYAACGGKIGTPSSLTVIIDDCPTTKNISATIISGTKHFEAIESINAQNLIKTGSKVEYNAGKSLTLSPGFKAETGTIFKAYIKGCVK